MSTATVVSADQKHLANDPLTSPARWATSYAHMLSWELRSMRLILPVGILVQLLIGAGMALGFGLLIGDLTETQALYLSTGVTVIAMITLGIVLVPQVVAQQKAEGIYDYIWSLPVPRTASVAASLTANSAIVIPGAAAALLVAWLRYDITLSLSPIVVPAALLTILTASSVGMGMAHAIPNPRVTQLITQVLIFVVLLFSPINFPAERLPSWLAAIHEGLPFQHAANLMRAGLTDGLATDVGLSFTIMSGWAVASWLLMAWPRFPISNPIDDRRDSNSTSQGSPTP
ncbi:MAG: hypothetical protein CL878_12875, partial [Dehalococcoidia bacterium]|nr:hypothetical protein [Dehalococcoidia bacterium]